LSQHLLNEDGEKPVEPLKGDKLCKMMDKFTTLNFPNVRKWLHFLSIVKVTKDMFPAFWLSKANSGYDYIQDSYFPRQHYGKKMLLFKMSMDGNNSRYDLMK